MVSATAYQKMFKQAKLKLTAWYLAIIMAITIAFSSTVYMSIERSTQTALETQVRRIQRQMHEYGDDRPMPRFFEAQYDIDALLEFRHRVLLNLVGINLLVFVIAGGLGYFLAGKTLAPIEKMTNKQKRFISDAAHEMKTPLTAMKTDLEVTLRDKNLNLEDSKQTMNNTIEEIDKLHLLTNRLLKESQNGYEENITQELKVNEILMKVLGKLKNMASEKDQTISSDLKPSKIKGDPTKIEELFTNIIENAIKYNKPGKEVKIISYAKNGQSVTKVFDEGIGISEEDLPNIFEPFYRADKSRTDSTKEGFGLGLSIAKKIVDNHSGEIQVKSKLGKETTVTVYLPTV